MTEMTDIQDTIPVAVRQFVLEWGNLGERWGVNRSVSQIHALLYASKQPLAAEDIADALGIARSNVSNSLRELQTWNLIRPVPVLGDRRTFYQAETDLWTLVSRIAAGRNAILKMPVLPVQGGVPIMTGGECVGAVGVSGVQSHEDEQIALAGVNSLG